MSVFVDKGRGFKAPRFGLPAAPEQIPPGQAGVNEWIDSFPARL
jgi:hypothetical protein